MICRIKFYKICTNQPNTNGVTHYIIYRAKAAAEKKAADDKAAAE